MSKRAHFEGFIAVFSAMLASYETIIISLDARCDFTSSTYFHVACFDIPAGKSLLAQTAPRKKTTKTLISQRIHNQSCSKLQQGCVSTVAIIQNQH